MVRFRLMVAGVLVGRGVALVLVIVVRMLWFRKFNSRMEVMVAMVDRMAIARRSLEVVMLIDSLLILALALAFGDNLNGIFVHMIVVIVPSLVR